MTPEEIQTFERLELEVQHHTESLEKAKTQLTELALSVYTREGNQDTFLANGREILILLNRNRQPYFTPRSRWAKQPGVKHPIRQDGTFSRTAKNRVIRPKKAIVDGQLVEVPKPPRRVSASARMTRIDKAPEPNSETEREIQQLTEEISNRKPLTDAPLDDDPEEVLEHLQDLFKS